MKVVFFATPAFAVPFLNALVNAPQIEVVAVVTQPAKPVGRTQIMTPSDVAVRAQALGISVFPFPTLKSESVRMELTALRVDAFVVVAYGKLIPKSILDIPRKGCVNVHPSRLPQYRGPSPMQTAIEHGDTQTAVSIMLLDEGMDTGPLLAQKTLDVRSDDTTASLSDRVAQIGSPFLVETLRLYEAGALVAVPQTDKGVSITKLLDRESGKIDLHDSPEAIERKIRAYTPWPGTYTVIEHNGKPLRVKILSSRLVDNSLELIEVQPEGGRVMRYEEFKRGYGTLIVCDKKQHAP